ncbi:amidase [Bradyrhizobium sp. 521_C7_N1_3]|uniref:amidase n=1 Tax=Bradyrhizobium sp. 521_C7_N1_3 TaxID=3240368 RepID=UPI003F8C4BDC
MSDFFGMHYLSLTDLSCKIRYGEISSTAVTRAMLDRIAALDVGLKSYITVTADHALARACLLEGELTRGMWRGPLHGVPVAVKDSFFTTFAPTSGGMVLHRSFTPSYNSTVVDRLERAGAVILGKLSMTEGAFGGHHQDMPTPVNPWNTSIWTGASSSGCGVASAAGLCFASVGSDAGGSIRLPSAACGLTGLQPTWGRVSRHGTFALADSLDHIGPMTRTVADAAAIMTAISGADPHDPATLRAPVPNFLAELGGSINGLRVGLDERFVFDTLDPDVAQVMVAAVAAFRDLGARILPVEMPKSETLVESLMNLCMVEMAIAHDATYPSRAAEYGPKLRMSLEVARSMSGLAYGKAAQDRMTYSGQLAGVFEDVDLLIVPVFARITPPVSELDELARTDIKVLLGYTAPFTMSHNPTLTLQGGIDRNGVPIGFQLVGPHLSEAMLLRAGHAFQQITDWHCRHPDLFAKFN